MLSLAVILLAAGCGSAATTSAPPATTLASTTAAAMPAGCPAALSSLPPVPATAQQAADDVAALGGHKGTTLGTLLDKVAADASAIGLALDTGGDVTGAVTSFKADEAAVRSYCA